MEVWLLCVLYMWLKSHEKNRVHRLFWDMVLVLARESVVQRLIPGIVRLCLFLLLPQLRTRFFPVRNHRPGLCSNRLKFRACPIITLIPLSFIFIAWAGPWTPYPITATTSFLSYLSGFWKREFFSCYNILDNTTKINFCHNSKYLNLLLWYIIYFSFFSFIPAGLIHFYKISVQFLDLFVIATLPDLTYCKTP